MGTVFRPLNNRELGSQNNLDNGTWADRPLQTWLRSIPNMLVQVIQGHPFCSLSGLWDDHIFGLVYFYQWLL